jgi:two-component system, response regulator
MTLRQVEILLVEDSSADAEMTMRTLKRRGIANHMVWVRDGVEALEYLFCEGEYAGRASGDPKLVMLDIKMPRMDGLQVLEKLKRDPRTQRIPVVMMTSSREEFDLLASYTLGVNSYVVKPVDFDAFAGIVAQVGMYWMIANEVPD